MATAVRLAVLVMLVGCTRGGHPAGESAFGRPWVFVIDSANVAPTQANGDAWDPDLSPPDPYALVHLNGLLIAMTGTDDNTYQPRWDYPTMSNVINEGDVVTIDLTDSDDFVDDPIIVGCDVPITQDAADAGSGTCDSTSASLDYEIRVSY